MTWISNSMLKTREWFSIKLFKQKLLLLQLKLLRRQTS
jgi:hypothetical protein